MDRINEVQAQLVSLFNPLAIGIGWTWNRPMLFTKSLKLLGNDYSLLFHIGNDTIGIC
jgi:hypothetical protein